MDLIEFLFGAKKEEPKPKPKGEIKIIEKPKEEVQKEDDLPKLDKRKYNKNNLKRHRRETNAD